MRPHYFLAAFLALQLIKPLEAAYKMGTNKPTKIEPGTAPQPKTIKKAPTRVNPNTQFDETPVLMRLSQQFNVEFSQLEYCRKLKYGYEELVPSIVVAKEAGVEIGRILSHRDRGQTWKDIAQHYGIDLSPLNRRVVETLKPLNKSLPKRLMKERPAYIPNDGK